MYKFRIPAARILNNSSATLGFNTNTVVVNASGMGFAIITTLHESATITSVATRLQAKAGTPGTLQMSLQSVGTNGLPTGTILASGNAKGTIDVNTVTAANWMEVTLTSAPTLNRGELFALVVESTGATWSAGNTATLTTIINGLDEGSSFPYFTTISGGVHTKSNQRQHECFKLYSSTKTYGNPIRASETSVNVTASLEIGLRFNIPTTYGRFFRVVGVFGTYQTQNVGSTIDFDLKLYEWNGGSNSTALQVVSRNNQQFVDTSSARGTGEFFFDEANLSVLETGKDYILSYATTSATAPIAATYMNVVDADKTAYFDGTWKYVTRTSSTGSWSETADRWPSLEILVEDMTNILVHPGMAGGMRG